MKKIGLICLAVVVALGGLGAAYAMWADTVVVTTTVNTGSVSVSLVDQVSNDPAPRGVPGDSASYFQGSLDPEEEGVWDLATKTWSLDRWPKNVASTDCAIAPSGEFMVITITNGYPSYWGSVLVGVQNTGTIPVKPLGIKLLSVSQDGTVIAPTDLNFVPYDPSDPAAWDGRLLFDTEYYLDQNDPYYGPELGEVESLEDPLGTPFRDYDEAITFIISSENIAQIEPGGTCYFDVTMHVEQAAHQLSQYDFTFKLEFCNWNE